MRTTRHVGVLLAVLLCGLTGCAGAGGSASEPPASGQQTTTRSSTPPVAPTKEKYERAVRDMGACLATDGVRLDNEGWDPVGQRQLLISYAAPGMPQDELVAAVDACQATTRLSETEFRYVEGNEPRMAADLMGFLRTCLAEKDIVLTGDERTSHDVLDAVSETRRSDVVSCATDGVRQLYPKVSAIAFP